MSAPETKEPGKQVESRPDRTPLTQRDPAQLANLFFQSGYFSDVRSAAQAVVKMAAGEELGLGPMASMQGIHIIEGKPSLSANLLGVQVRRSDRYDYRVVERSDEKVSLEWFQDGEKIGDSDFTIEQARKISVRQKGAWIKLAETSRWENYPQAMLFARALSAGVRLHCPDVTAGSPAYTPEELGAEVDAQGEPIAVEVETVTEDPAAPDPERIEYLVNIAKGIEVTGLVNGERGMEDLNVLLGSLGIDGFDPASPITDQLARLTEEQADALAAELQRMADADAEGGEADA